MNPGVPWNVLLVEDDDADFVLARRFLSQGGARRFALQRAETLAAALSAVEHDIDVVLLDLTLPDSRGLDTFLRLHQHAPHLPIVLLTGLEDETLGVRAVREGAQDYLVKGHLERALLERAVIYAIERKQAEERLAQVADELRVRNEQLRDDLAMAREVQMALLPRQFPRIPPDAAPGEEALRFGRLYRPCGSVGGDFYAVWPLAGDAVGVFTCDVMGHGTQAALVTAVVRGLLEELRGLADDPGRLLTELNRGLVAVLRSPDQLIFVTAVYLVLNARDGAVRLATAGHPAPLLVRAASGTAAWMANAPAASGPVLGIDEWHGYVTAPWQLEPGDRVVLFTDGLYEVRNPAGVDYERDRLLTVAAAHVGAELPTLLEALLEDPCRFAGGAEPEDDVCLLGLEYRGLRTDSASAPAG